MVDHKDYGHKRIAIELKMVHKRWVKKKDIGRPDTGIPNLVQSLLNRKLLVKPNQVWCIDSMVLGN